MKRIFRRKTFQIALIAANVLLAAWIVRSYDFEFLNSARNVLFDQYQRLKPRSAPPLPVRIIDIDEESIQALGQWPWPRNRVAQLVDRLAELGAATIAFDIVFSEPDRTSPVALLDSLFASNSNMDSELRKKLEAFPDNDQVLAQSLKNASTVVGFFGATEQHDGSPRQSAGYVFAGDDPKSSLVYMKGAITSLQVLQDSATGVASVSLTGGRTSDVIRRVPLFITDGTNIFPTLSMEALRVATGASTFLLKTTTASGETSWGAGGVVVSKVADFVIPTTASGEIQLYYGYDKPEDYLSASLLLGDAYRDLAPLVEGNIIFIGTSAIGLSDLRVTALGQTVPGVSLHAQIVKQILTGSFLQRPDWVDGAEMVMAVAVTLLMMGVLPFTGAFVSALFGAACSSFLLAISWIAFDRFGILLEPIFAMATGAVVYVVSVTLTFAATEREKRFVRSAFQQYLAPSLLKKLEASPEDLVLGGEIREITMMFLDIRGFTGISEKLRPDELVAFVNQLFSPLSDIIQRNDGVIDKYIGDSIMAFWNAPLDVADHQRKACLAALEMLDAVEALNRDDRFGFRSNSIGIKEARIGIGINAGEACVGNMGSSSRFNYSVVGDTVNIAARIETETKEMGWPVLVSAATVEAVPELAFLSVGNLLLKGKSRGIELYALIGNESYKSSDEFKNLQEHHGHLVRLIGDRHGKQTSEALAKCSKIAPTRLAPLYKALENRIEERKLSRVFD